MHPMLGDHSHLGPTKLGRGLWIRCDDSNFIASVSQSPDEALEAIFHTRDMRERRRLDKDGHVVRLVCLSRARRRFMQNCSSSEVS